MSDVRVAPRLVVGLGNPAAGDDGVGWRVAERLAGDARLPRDVEVLCGGADVLRLARLLDGRRDLLLVDACLGMTPGAVDVVDHDALARSTPARPHAHHLAAVEAVELLRALGDVSAERVRWALIGVEDVRQGDGLTEPLAAALPAIVESVLAAVAAAEDDSA